MLSSVFTGYHIMERINPITREYIPAQDSSFRFNNQIIDSVEKLNSGLPDYDSGYFYVEAGTDYSLTHDLGSIPSRITCFCCAEQEPKEQSSIIYYLPFLIIGTTGIMIGCKNRTTFDISTGSAYIYLTSTYGFIRIMAWR